MIQIGDVIQARLEGADANQMGSSHSKPRSMLHPGKLLPISKCVPIPRSIHVYRQMGYSSMWAGAAGHCRDLL